jgi:hypothetical protein
MNATRSLVLIAGVAGLIAGASLATHRRRERDRRALNAKPEPVQTWEGEGGAVPMTSGRTAQQVSPSSADAAPMPRAREHDELETGPDYEQGGPPH